MARTTPGERKSCGDDMRAAKEKKSNEKVLGQSKQGSQLRWQRREMRSKMRLSSVNVFGLI